MKEGKGFYKLNDESIAAVREDLAADYQALANHHSEEVIQLLEEYGTTDLEIACHLHQYEAERRATGLQPVETVELQDSPPEEPAMAPLTPREPTSTTLVPTDAEPDTVFTQEPTPVLKTEITPSPAPTSATTIKSTPQPKPRPAMTTEPMPQLDLMPKTTMGPTFDRMSDPEPPLQDTPTHLNTTDTTQTQETETVAP